jgi:hypothetical protein
MHIERRTVAVKWATWAGVMASLMMIGCGERPSEPEETVQGAVTTGAALMVVGSTTLSAADQAVQRRLVALGLTVSVVKDSAATTAQATGKKLVVISSTVASGAVGTKFRAVAVPVLVWEPSLFGNMAMTGTSGSAAGTTSGQTQLSLVAATTDPLAAGLSGTQTVTTSASTFTWGEPASGAVVVARIAGSSAHDAIFRYEKSASMSGLAAPERRVGFFLGDTTASTLTSAGQNLTDAAIRWAAHLAAPLGGACTTASGCASGFCVGGVCCNSACTGACLSCNAPGSAGTCSPLPAGTACGAASCSGSTFSQAPACDGAGACQPAPAISCAPYTCGQASCRTSCATSTDCVTGTQCLNGLCASAAPLGGACTTASGCASGFCVGGVCCNSACTGTCLSCNAPGSAGTCSPLPAGTACGAASCSGSTFSQAPTCDGAGACQPAPAISCAPYTCGQASCRTSCATSTDCVTGTQCLNGLCT